MKDMHERRRWHSAIYRRSIALVLIAAALSGCSITVDRFVAMDNVKVTEGRLLFTVGRTEFRHFAMADRESHTVLRATASLYSASPEQEHSAQPLAPVLQTDATAWMHYLAPTDLIVVDMVRNTLQSVSQPATVAEPLVPPGEQATSPRFGREGYFYLAGSSFIPTYVPAGGSPCTVPVANIPVQDAHYFLSDDGRYLAVMANRDRIANNAPKSDAAVELFKGCQPVATHQLPLAGNDRPLGVCVADGSVWYNVWHWRFSPDDRESAWRYGSSERLEINPEQLGRGLLSRHSFDCASKQFVWVDLLNGGTVSSLTSEVEVLIHRYQPVGGIHNVTKLKLNNQ